MKIVTYSQEVPLGCAFVPTMGALHLGHASLFKSAAKLNEVVVASIFVNPLQFESSKDLDTYPRTPDRDIELAEASGVTHLWLPRFEEIYPQGHSVLSAGDLGKKYEGSSRAAHFDGVVTVVRRFFDLIKPKVAIFGEKDFQQVALIREIADEVEIVMAPTIRDQEGLALSSRNARLQESERKSAQVISKALNAASAEKTLIDAQSKLQSILATEPNFTLDYAAIIDEKNFEVANEATQFKRAIVAGWINGVRLIDSAAMNGPIL